MLGLGSLATKIFGNSNDRKVKKYRPIVAQINALESETAALDDEALRGRTDTLRERVAAGESWRSSSPKPSRQSARPPAAHWASVISTFSWSAAWSSTKAGSPR